MAAHPARADRGRLRRNRRDDGDDDDDVDQNSHRRRAHRNREREDGDGDGDSSDSDSDSDSDASPDSRADRRRRKRQNNRTTPARMCIGPGSAASAPCEKKCSLSQSQLVAFRILSNGTFTSDPCGACKHPYSSHGNSATTVVKVKTAPAAAGAAAAAAGSPTAAAGGGARAAGDAYAVTVDGPATLFHLKLLTSPNSEALPIFGHSIAEVRAQAARLLGEPAADKVKLTVTDRIFNDGRGIELVDTPAGFAEACLEPRRPIIAGVRGNASTSPQRPQLHINTSLARHFRDDDIEVWTATPPPAGSGGSGGGGSGGGGSGSGSGGGGALQVPSTAPPTSPPSTTTPGSDGGSGSGSGGTPERAKRLKVVSAELTDLAEKRDRRTDRITGVEMSESAVAVAHVFNATNKFVLHAGTRAGFPAAALCRFYPTLENVSSIVDPAGMITRTVELELPPQFAPTPNDLRNVITVHAELNGAIEFGHCWFEHGPVVTSDLWLAIGLPVWPMNILDIVASYIPTESVVCFSDVAIQSSEYARKWNGHVLRAPANPAFAPHDLSRGICDLHSTVLAPYARSRHPHFCAIKDVAGQRDKALITAGFNYGSVCIGPDFVEPRRECAATRRPAPRNNSCSSVVCAACCHTYFNGCGAHTNNRLSLSHSPSLIAIAAASEQRSPPPKRKSM